MRTILFALVSIMMPVPGFLSAGVCTEGVSAGPVAEPVFVTNLAGQTGCFAGPVAADLDQDGSRITPLSTKPIQSEKNLSTPAASPIA